MEPVCFTGVALPCTKQFSISKEAMAATKVVIKDLWDMGIVENTHSASDSPVWTVKKSSGDWRVTVDYRNANEAISKLTPLVADTSTIFSSLSPAHSVFSVIDVANGFCLVCTLTSRGPSMPCFF